MANTHIPFAGDRPYIIAEIGSNFDQSLDRATEMIQRAARAGADMVKFQLFRAEALYPDGGEMFDLFKSIELNPNWVPDLLSAAREAGVQFSASPFDLTSLEVLTACGVDAIKIASSEATNLSLISAAARSKLPILLSTGMCDLEDVTDAVALIERMAPSHFAVLQCGAVYPQAPKDVHLNVLRTYRALFDCPVGFSDHTSGNTAAIAAVALGATVFEKHVTHDRNADGPDHAIAFEFDELAEYVKSIHEAVDCLGSPVKQMLADEKAVGRREGLYAASDLKAGDILSADNLVVRRPAIGIRAKKVSMIDGRMRLLRDIPADSPIDWTDVTF